MSNEEIKAKELIEKFYKEISHGNIVEAEYEELFLYQKSAKQCALILCEEKISEFTEMNNNIMGLQFNDKINYWQQVKQQIQNHE